MINPQLQNFNTCPMCSQVWQVGIDELVTMTTLDDGKMKCPKCLRVWSPPKGFNHDNVGASTTDKK